MLESSIKATKKAILKFVEAESWAECKQVVEAQPNLLLSDAADEMLAAWIEQSEGNRHAVRVFGEYRQLLARCRQEGIDAAFADRVRPSQEVYNALLALVQAENWAECKQLVERNANLLLNEQANRVLLSWLKQSQQDSHAMRVFHEYRELLLRCRQEGIEAAFAERVRPPKAVFDAVRLLIEAKDEASAKAVLAEKRALLLNPAADQVFAFWLKQAQNNPRTTAVLKKYRAWLARYRANDGANDGASPLTDSPQALSQAVQAFVAAKSWRESKEIVLAQQALLLSEMADNVFIILLKQAQHDPAAVRMLQQHRDLLDMCRREGVEAAFARIQPPLNALSRAIEAFIDANSWQESKQIVERERDLLLSDEADHFLANLVAQHQGQQKLVRLYQEHRQLLRRCRLEGIENAFTQPLQPLQQLSEALLSFVDAADKQERRQIVEEQHELLLGEGADKLFGVLIEQAKKDPARVKRLQRYRELLRMSRTDGIKLAFSQPMALFDLAPDLRARLMAVQSQKEFDELLNRYPELLSVLEEISPTSNQAAQASASSPLLPNEELAKTLFTFVAAESWPESKTYLENHPELLSTEADRMLIELLAQHSTNAKEQEVLQEHHKLLRDARRRGIQAAFANLAPAPRHVIPSVRKYLNAERIEEQKAIITAERDLLLSDAADEVLANLQAGYQTNSQSYLMLKKRRALLAEARRKGVEAAFADYHRSVQRKEFHKVMFAFLDAKNDEERQQLIEANPHLLLTEEAQDYLNNLQAQSTEEPATREQLERQRDLLKRVRKEGIEAAFAPFKQASVEPDALAVTTPKEEQAVPAHQASHRDDDEVIFDEPNEEQNEEQEAEEDDEVIFDEPSEEEQQEQEEEADDDWWLGLDFDDDGNHEASEEEQQEQEEQGDDDWWLGLDLDNERNNDLNHDLNHQSQSHLTASPIEKATNGTDKTHNQQNSYQDSLFDEDTVLETVLTFVEAKSWAESKRIVEQHQQILLTDQAERIFKDLLREYNYDVEIARLLAQHHELLQRIRRDGIEAAFAKEIGASSRQEIPQEFTLDLEVATTARERLKQDNSSQALNAAVQAWQRLFNRPKLKHYPHFQADVQSELGAALLRRYWELEEASDLNAAIQTYQQVLELTSRNAPSLPGRLNNLGLSLRARFALHQRQQDVNAAIMAYREALKLIEPDANERPSILNNLGVALTDRYNLQPNPQDLNDAIMSYQEALNLLPEEATNRHAIEENLKLALQDRLKHEKRAV